MKRTYSELTDNEVIQRIEMCDRWMKKFRDADVDQSNRYIDANGQSATDDWDWEDGFEPENDTPERVPVGQPNYFAINTETKVAAIAMGNPALHVRANEDPEKGGVPNASQIVAKAWEQSFELGNWKREFQAGLQKKDICGLGAIWYRWDSEYGPCFEHVSSKRLLLDPHATNLHRMDYGGVKIRMPLRKAMELYDPNGENEYFNPLSESMDLEGKNLDNTVVVITVFYDKKNEYHVYDKKVLFRDKNLYGRVTLIPNEGFIDPRDRPLPLGMNIFASGLNQQVVDLAGIASSAAKHGGQITIGDANFFDVPVQTALKEGKPQQIILAKKPLNPQAPPIIRIPGEQLAPAWNEARREAQSALDGIMGVSPAMRGEMTPNVTATQSVQVENRSGARTSQERADYEAWMNRIANAYVEMMQKFGGPTEEDPGTDETRLIWEAFKAVYEVKVVEGSTSYKDPAADQQQSMQLYTTLVQSFELWLALAQQGIVREVPNLKQYADDCLRAFARQNIEQYWLPAPEPQQDQGPNPDVIKALATIFKDAPMDVKGQIEQALGLNASQMGEQAEGDGGATPAELQAQTAEQAADIANENRMQDKDHAHEIQMELLKQRGELQKAQVQAEQSATEMMHEQQMAAHQAEVQTELADKNNKAAIDREKAKPKPAAKPRPKRAE